MGNKDCTIYHSEVGIGVIKVSVGFRVGIVTLSYSECFTPENLAQNCQMITKIWFAED